MHATGRSRRGHVMIRDREIGIGIGDGARGIERRRSKGNVHSRSRLRCADNGRCGVQRSERQGPSAARTGRRDSEPDPATPRDNVQDGGTFTWPIDSFPVNFNYHELDGTDVGTAQIDSAPCCPTPFTIDAAGTPIWNRDLLASEPTFSRSSPGRW